MAGVCRLCFPRMELTSLLGAGFTEPVAGLVPALGNWTRLLGQRRGTLGEQMAVLPGQVPSPSGPTGPPLPSPTPLLSRLPDAAGIPDSFWAPGLPEP